MPLTGNLAVTEIETLREIVKKLTTQCSVNDYEDVRLTFRGEDTHGDSAFLNEEESSIIREILWPEEI